MFKINLILVCFLLGGCGSSKKIIRKTGPKDFGYNKMSQVKTTVWEDSLGKFHAIHDRTSEVSFERNKDDEIKFKVNGKNEGVVSKIAEAATAIATAKVLEEDN